MSKQREANFVSQNSTDLDEFLEKYIKMLSSLAESKVELDAAFKYTDLYGEWGMICARYMNPFLWVFPFAAATLLFMTFKRQNLFGNVQICLVSVMVADVLFAMLTGFKDAVFNFMNWNYGFVEYKLCTFLFLFARIQTSIHGTSLWIKSLMLLHRVLMFLFPFKFRSFKFKIILLPLGLFHCLVVVSYCALTFKLPFRSFSTFQDYSKGKSFKRIDACVIHAESKYFEGAYHNIEQYLALFLQTVYFTSFPISIHFVCTLMFVFLVKKEIKKMSFLTPVKSTKISKSVKYIILIKVHIFLGISFILQETPIYISFFVLYFSKNIKSVKNANSIVVSYMILTFAIGKPIDLIIYASLSQKVKSELKRIFCCLDKTKLKKELSSSK